MYGSYGFCSLVDILDKVNAAGKKERELYGIQNPLRINRTDKGFLQINQNKAEIAKEIKASKGYEQEITCEGAPTKLMSV